MKPKELRELSLEELVAKAQELRGELFAARVRHETGQLEDTAKLRTLRRNVARVETLMHDKQGAKA